MNPALTGTRNFISLIIVSARERSKSQEPRQVSTSHPIDEIRGMGGGGSSTYGEGQSAPDGDGEASPMDASDRAYYEPSQINDSERPTSY